MSEGQKQTAFSAMPLNKQYVVLKYIKEKILNDFPESKLISEKYDTVNIQIADSKIRLKQFFDLSGTCPFIYADDIDNILHQKDYIKTLHNIYEGAEGNENLYTSLKITSILINGASTELLFILDDVVQGFFKVLGRDYEVIELDDLKPQSIIIKLKLGEYKFDVLVENNQFHVILTPAYKEKIPTSIQKEINTDTLNIQLEATGKHKKVFS